MAVIDLRRRHRANSSGGFNFNSALSSRKVARVLNIAAILAFVLNADLNAHSGRTDSRGGHFDRRNGTYHYHHGMGPHQHPNGICPYSFQIPQREPPLPPFHQRNPAMFLSITAATAFVLHKIIRKLM